MIVKSLIATGAVLVGMLLNYIFNFSMTRLITPDLYGQLSILVGILSILTVPMGSIQSILSREIAKLDKKKKKDEIIFLVRRYSKFMALGGVVAGIGVFIFSYLITLVGLKGTLTVPLQIIAFGVVFMFVLSVIKAYYQGREKINKLSVILILEPVLKLAAGVVLVLLGFGIFGATLSLWIGSLALAVLIIPFFIRKIRVKEHKLKISKSFILVTAASTLMMLFLYLDLFFVTYNIGVEAAGFYNVASITSKILFYGIGGVILVILPTSSKLNLKTDRKKFRGLILKSMAFLVPVIIIFLLFPQQIITIFYTEAYASSVMPFLILSIGMLMFSVFKVLSSIMWSQHMEKQPLIIMAVAVVMDMILLKLLVPTQGMIGAAWATSIVSVFCMVASIVVLRKLL